MNRLDFNGVSLIGNISSISEIKTLPSGKEYRFFDICQNSKYIDKNGEEKDNKLFFSIRLVGNQISKYESIIKSGNWIHVIGKLRNYLTKDMTKKFYISVDSIKGMKPKEKKEIFDYDWLEESNCDEYLM